ncbi:type IV secretion system protein VirB10 [Brevundimonas diminuta]|uniref:type IV secretion system protein VirB10 n=1 Tax=Brevundimonas diminuta TaxID=293 RepID=UPI0018E03665|nr:type IV secretion system protein VirB10 [Brevundimonas diminuta]
MSATDHPRAPEENGAPTGQEPDRVTNDRGVSPIAGRPGGLRSRWITLAALAAGCSAFLFATWDRGDRPARPAPEEPARQLVPFEPVRRPAEPPLLSLRAGDPDAPSLTGEPVIPAIDDATPSPHGHVGPASEEQRQSLAESARRAPVLAYSRSGVDAGRAPVGPPPSTVPAPDGGPGVLDQLRQISPVRRVEAGRLPDRRFLIIAGTTVPCLLQTAMDSAAPGYVSCVVPRDVWSDDGSVVLMARGTRVLGEYRSGLQRGRGRLFVLWTRAVTPEGVAIPLASPAADALGRAGIGGRIDSHFRERFGGALLLSIVDGATMAAVDAGADRSIIRTPSDAASIALQDSVGIPPTLRKDQGAEVSILVAQDLDFSSVYRLRPR